MEYYETQLFPNILDTHENLWLRYVDDVFVIWPDSSDTDAFLESLNGLSPSITFKAEEENNGFISFLDVAVYRGSTRLSFSVFRKTLNCGSYLHSVSNHPRFIQKGVIQGFFLRAYRLCDPNYLDTEIRTIFDTFSRLGYKNPFISSAMHKARTKFHGLTQRIQQAEDLKTISIPYFSGLESLQRPFLHHNIRLVFTFPNTIKKLLIKNGPKSDVESGVYLVPCQECPEVYIGETKRSLKIRLDEHKRDVRFGVESNAIFVHSSNNDHPINWENSKIIYKTKDKVVSTFIESIFIKKTQNFNLSPGFNVPDDFISNFIWSILKLDKNI